MVDLAKKFESLGVSDFMLHAVVCHAQRQASLTGVFLRSAGIIEDQAKGPPAAFLLELGAVLELGLWEHLEARRHLDVNLPTYEEAFHEFVARCNDGPKAFHGPNAMSLSVRVLQTWIEHFAWDAPDLLGTEVVIRVADGDRIIETLAEFLWNNRYQLRKIVRSENQQ